MTRKKNTLSARERWDNSNALGAAAQAKNLAEVERLIPISDPKIGFSSALQIAAIGGWLEGVKLLLPVSDPTVVQSWPLQAAAERGHADVVRVLIPFSDVRADEHGAMRRAAAGGHLDIARELLAASDRAVALRSALGDVDAMRGLAQALGDEAVTTWETELRRAAMRRRYPTAVTFCAAWRAQQAVAETLALPTP